MEGPVGERGREMDEENNEMMKKRDKVRKRDRPEEDEHNWADYRDRIIE